MTSNYIKLSTMEYPRHIGDIELDPAGMADYAPVELVAQPPFNYETQYVQEKFPEQRDGKWYMAWEVLQRPAEDVAKHVRLQRNKRLAASDWSQLPDAPLTDEQRAQWAQYRRALRDIAEQPGFPYEVEWPVAPT
jgi:hypothetical protein